MSKHHDLHTARSCTAKLTGLDKCLEVRLVGVGETWRRRMYKCVLKGACQEAKEDSQDGENLRRDGGGN